MNLRSLLPISHGRWDAANPFESLQREIDRLIADFSRGLPAVTTASRSLTPKIDVKETDQQIEITAELPGLEEKDVQVDVTDNVLTIRGEKKAEREEKDANYQLVERSYGAFQRSLELPEGVDVDAVTAELAKGVLKVTVPKPALAQQKKVEVKSAA